VIQAKKQANSAFPPRALTLSNPNHHSFRRILELSICSPDPFISIAIYRLSSLWALLSGAGRSFSP
jgi:hypothetical protein